MKKILAASEKLDECEAWASIVEFDFSTTYNSAKCSKELTLTKLYVYKDESESNNNDPISPAILGCIVIIFIIIIKNQFKHASSSSEKKKNEPNDNDALAF
ncbi:hypothetical protein TRFO_27684 [Tritrichomonas foetus]|uniref:Uncharacterized protein n=1 Tax=Tritrichomonas foetus TaxID=1144522 RepID=A0A1J4JZU1_9EUKA|nr:hypothetical protein TRFO_27684 [Tritrichomonas foetus]|eukprot:OHT04687.1 hypothetical protein TRFO_27684 [Tritrichomonas foetus]